MLLFLTLSCWHSFWWPPLLPCSSPPSLFTAHQRPRWSCSLLTRLRPGPQVRRLLSLQPSFTPCSIFSSTLWDPFLWFSISGPNSYYCQYCASLSANLLEPVDQWVFNNWFSCVPFFFWKKELALFYFHLMCDLYLKCTKYRLDYW